MLSEANPRDAGVKAGVSASMLAAAVTTSHLLVRRLHRV